MVQQVSLQSFSVYLAKDLLVKRSGLLLQVFLMFVAIGNFWLK
jgi:hypothetical protein